MRIWKFEIFSKVFYIPFSSRYISRVNTNQNDKTARDTYMGGVACARGGDRRSRDDDFTFGLFYPPRAQSSINLYPRLLEPRGCRDTQNC